MHRSSEVVATSRIKFVDPVVEFGDRVIQGGIKARITGGAGVVIRPVRVRAHDWRPIAWNESELFGLGCAGIEDRLACCTQVCVGGGGVGGQEVAQEEQVDEVTRAVVDRVRRIVRIGAGVELLGDLEAQRDSDKDVRAGSPKWDSDGVANGYG